jgi:ABC-2 type transport system permease protein
MTSLATAPTPAGRGSAPSPLRFLRETRLLTGRSLRAIPRVPERLLDVTIQPVIFILLFLYVFGSAIHVHGISYKNFLFPGIIAQTIAFGVIGSGTATATDMSEGVIDRFRSMPVNRLAIITGEVMGQLCEQVLGMVITIGVGFALGWRPEISLLGGIELVALFALGLFAFTAVPRAIAEWDPISALVATARNLTTHVHSSGSLLLDHPELAMLAWCLILLGVCMPLALRRFNNTVSA